VIVDHRNVGAAFRRLSLPVAAQMLGDQVLGVVDTIAIGSLGAVSLAGATAASTVFSAVLFAIFGLMTGTSIVAAQRIGAHDVDGFARTVRAGAIVPMLTALTCVIAALVGSGPVVHALVGNLPSADASATYLTLRCFCIVPIVISGTLIVGLGAAGNQILGVLVLVVINVIHIPLLFVLGLGFGTHHPMGVAGIGLSSLLSETAGAIYAVGYAARRPIYRIFASLTVSWPVARECARLGLPESVFLLGVMLPDIFIVKMLAPLGPIIVSAFRRPRRGRGAVVSRPRAAVRRGDNLGCGRYSSWSRLAAGVRIHAQRNGGESGRPPARGAHDHAAAQRLGNGFACADSRVGRHPFFNERRPGMQRVGHPDCVVWHRTAAHRPLQRSARMDHRVERASAAHTMETARRPLDARGRTRGVVAPFERKPYDARTSVSSP
jgi:hypothetical protein